GKTFQPYSSNANEVIYSISRGNLNKTLMNAAEAYGTVEFHFNHRCDGIDKQAREILLTNEETQQKSRVKADAIIGTDGAYSAVRQQFFYDTRFNYSQQYLEH